MAPRFSFALGLTLFLTAVGCREKSPTYKTTVTLLHVHPFGSDPQAPTMVAVEFAYSDCPGNSRQLVRGDKTFAQCSRGWKIGDRLPAEIKHVYLEELAEYQSDVIKLGACPIQVDLRDEANYETIEECKEILASGSVVGVRCHHHLSDDAIAKCPWLRNY
ncbi:MAG: hypothetical protein RMJ98_07735 [Myxococcales bacterium]|nr:hypothetical protein [Polyangiaceae bacterium]MDW8249176.1 hypothetical protein [Myxococcales bacterium]